jgi:hypothetical protein
MPFAMEEMIAPRGLRGHNDFFKCTARHGATVQTRTIQRYVHRFGGRWRKKRIDELVEPFSHKYLTLYGIPELRRLVFLQRFHLQ